ncbi:MAG: DUF192 domain-containing protein [Nanoarchaeota archaeon]
MPIKNATKNEIVSKSPVFIDDIFSKFVGLMFSKRQHKGLIFRFRKEKVIALHMLFVFYPIDVLFLDENLIVVDKKENFKPFAFYTSRRKAMYAIELPNGTIKKTRTEIGDKIKF